MIFVSGRSLLLASASTLIEKFVPDRLMLVGKVDGGGGGIRTHGTVTRTAVFKTAAL